MYCAALIPSNLVAVTIYVDFFSLSQVPYSYIEYDSHGKLWPGVRRAYDLVDRFQLVNSYGLFRRMTGVSGRPEVVIEGSNDAVSWTVRGRSSQWQWFNLNMAVKDVQS